MICGINGSSCRKEHFPTPASFSGARGSQRAPAKVQRLDRELYRDLTSLSAFIATFLHGSVQETHCSPSWVIKENIKG